MSNKRLCIKVPGKLMVAGEYAVLEPNQRLIAMAVDRFVYATIQPSDANKLTLKNFNLINIPWEYNAGKMTIQSTDNRVRFVKDAMNMALTYLSECSITLKPFTLTIKSELDDESGIKYGLGSSAAVVVSVITAILKKHIKTDVSAHLIFKLAAISHVNTQQSGSGADVAASVYGGMIEYSSFQAEWLKNEYAHTPTLKALVEQEWNYLFVRQITLPSNIHMYVGWTGSPAKTANLIEQLLKLKQTDQQTYEHFIKASEQAVHTIIQGVDDNNRSLFLDGIKQNREALSSIGKKANVDIETRLLAKLSDAAEEADGAGKLSGAGGGDCGIAFLQAEEKSKELLYAWDQFGIKQLHVSIEPLGAATYIDD